MTDHLPSNGAAPTESPAEAMDRLALQLAGVRRLEVGNSIEYDRAGVLFAARNAATLSFHLREEVVAAALNTLGTARSARGSDWIALAATTDAADTFTLDRAVAWFESAWRLAGSAA